MVVIRRSSCAISAGEDLAMMTSDSIRYQLAALPKLAADVSGPSRRGSCVAGGRPATRSSPSPKSEALAMRVLGHV